jgi:hypothetical protein
MDFEKDAIEDYIVAQSLLSGLAKIFLTSNAATNALLK